MRRGPFTGVVAGPFVVVLAVLICGCFISLLTGPSSVAIGTSATYTMKLNAESDQTNTTAVLAADVPLGWALTTATYAGTVNGAVVSGTPTVSSTNSCGSVPPPAAGYQRIFFLAGPH